MNIVRRFESLNGPNMSKVSELIADLVFVKNLHLLPLNTSTNVVNVVGMQVPLDMDVRYAYLP